MSTAAPILLVEDDTHLARELVATCEEFGLIVEHTADGRDGFERACDREYSLVILDIRLPRMNGLDICRELKARKPALPIILLTSKDKEVDRVLGFELGADDYVTKPFHMSELVARIRAKLRFIATLQQLAAPAPVEDAESFSIGDFQVDVAMRTVHRLGTLLELTPKEFDLLTFFLKHVGRVFTKAELLRAVWDVDIAGYEDAVVAMVRRLRLKIEDDPSQPRYLCASRGVGYYFTDPDRPAKSDL